MQELHCFPGTLNQTLARTLCVYNRYLARTWAKKLCSFLLEYASISLVELEHNELQIKVQRLRQEIQKQNAVISSLKQDQQKQLSLQQEVSRLSEQVEKRTTSLKQLASLCTQEIKVVKQKNN